MFALSDRAVDGVRERRLLFVGLGELDYGLQFAQDRVQLLLGVLRRQVLGRRAGAVASPPDDRAARREPTSVADMRRAEPASASFAILVIPEGPIGPSATPLVGADL